MANDQKEFLRRLQKIEKHITALRGLYPSTHRTKILDDMQKNVNEVREDWEDEQAPKG